MPISYDNFGWIEAPLSLAHAAAGDRLAVQFVLRVPLSFDAQALSCASQALELTVQ